MSPSGLNSPSNQPASPSTLAGSGQQAPDPNQSAIPGSGQQGQDAGEGTPNSPLYEAIQTLRQAEMEMMALGQRFPAAASALRQATSSIRAAQRQIIANPGQPEPSAPSIGG